MIKLRLKSIRFTSLRDDMELTFIKFVIENYILMNLYYVGINHGIAIFIRKLFKCMSYCFFNILLLLVYFRIPMFQ